MTIKVIQFAEIGTVTFRKNRRSKNIKISVKPDKSVLVSYPFYVTASEVSAFVLKNEDWIVAQQRKFAKRKTVVNHGTVIKTKLHSITFLKGEKSSIGQRERDITVKLTDFDDDLSQQNVERILTSVYKDEACELLPLRLQQLAEKYDFKYNRVTIRNNKRNWGSCSSANNISLNLQMMKLPNELIDYILLHELVHTKIKNHSPAFWKKLDEVTGNRAIALAKEVKKYSTYSL
ncbi:MAG: hypothetical protein CSA36_06300 [Draconibacterium sp.]|nr:MAG: hypothetical protein CSA36_06300 [Draconibacterium sp.]